jgi:hypothetical protein
MDVNDHGDYRIEVGLSKEDINSLAMGNHMIEYRGILTGEQKLKIAAFKNDTQRDNMVPEDQRMPAKITYAEVTLPPHVSEKVEKIIKKRDVIYAKGIGNGDVDVYMTQITAMAIQPDGIIEVNAKIPQLLKQHPGNCVRMYVKIPF